MKDQEYQMRIYNASLDLSIKIHCHKYICLIMLCLCLQIFENNDSIWISKLGSVGLMRWGAIKYVSVKPLELLAHWTWETDEIDKHSSFEIGEGNIQIQRNLIIPSTVFQLNVHFKSHNSIFLYYISIVGPDTGLFK